MLLTFIRLGFANNSSSSHSIIFSPKLQKDKSDFIDNYDEDFGWNYFTCASKESKAVYMFSNLYSNFPYTKEKHFSRWCEMYLSDLIKKYKIDVYSNSSVDHQSVILLPSDYGTHHGYPSIEFFKAFAQEIIEKPYFILGGNDNDMTDHPLSYNHQTGKDNILKFISNIKGNGEMSTVYDKNTGEWILSNKNSGNLLKVVFDKDIKPHHEMNMETILNLDDDFNLYNTLDFKSTAPYLVDISITNYCDIGCRFCYQSSTIQGQHADTNFIIDKVLPTLLDSKVFEIVFGGGEPTQHPDFDIIIKAAYEMGFKVGVTTKNFEYWNKAPQIVKYIHSLAFSCQSKKHIQSTSLIFKTLKDKFSIDVPRIYVQLILELNTIKKLEKLFKTSSTNGLTDITLLGYKDFGFGKNIQPKKISSNWISTIKTLSKKYWINLGVDSVIVKKYKSELIHHGVEYNYLVGTDGKQTCYIDAINQTISSSSFTKNNIYKFDSTQFLNIFSEL